MTKFKLYVRMLGGKFQTIGMTDGYPTIDNLKSDSAFKFLHRSYSSQNPIEYEIREVRESVVESELLK